jgi:glycosyltransferase involved in cell wall biosynthesis
MKILHFLWALQNGGAENLAVDLANEQSNGNDVILFVANDRIDESVRSRIISAVQFVSLGRPEGSRNPVWLARLLFFLRALRPDVVHTHSANLSALGRFITAPMVLTVHDTHIELKQPAKRFAMVCCISDAVLQDVRNRYPQLKACKINNGVLTAQIATQKPDRSDVVRCVQISRLVHEKKGQDLLIKAMAIVNKMPAHPKLTVDFIGDGPSLNYLKAIAEEVGVSENCRFVGAQPRNEIYQQLCKYDILIQPSRYEGFGLTVAEGMVAGVAVVVSDSEGPMEIIGEGRFGMSFQTNSAEALAVALQNAIDMLHTPEGNARLLAARNHAIGLYGLQQTSAHYCQIYREVINA